jgi:hypothetical protein
VVDAYWSLNNRHLIPRKAGKCSAYIKETNIETWDADTLNAFLLCSWEFMWYLCKVLKKDFGETKFMTHSCIFSLVFWLYFEEYFKSLLFEHENLNRYLCFFKVTLNGERASEKNFTIFSLLFALQECLYRIVNARSHTKVLV